MPRKGRRIGPQSVFKQVQRKLFKGVFGAFGRLQGFLRLSLQDFCELSLGLLWSLLGAFLGLSRGSYLEVLLAPQGPSWGPLGTFGFMSSCWPTWPLSWARPRPFGGGPILTTIFILFNLRLSELSWGTLELSWGSLGYLFGLAWGSLDTPLLGC